jgi:flagellar protein FliO/FliZ
LLRFAFLFFMPFQALASETQAPGVSSGSYLQAMLALALIIAVLLGTAWLARKVSGGKVFGQGGMKVIGGVALGPRERLVLVEVGDTWLVIGLVPGQIRTLHQLPKGSDCDITGTATGDSDAPFKQWLKSISERNRNA